jgi:hypothetical protein
MEETKKQILTLSTMSENVFYKQFIKKNHYVDNMYTEINKISEINKNKIAVLTLQ